MFLLKQILPAVILTMMVAAGTCGCALIWGKDRARGAVAPVALGIAYFVGHLFVAGWVRFPPSDSTNWLPYFALAGAVLGAWAPEGRASAPRGREESRVSETRAWMHLIVLALVSTGALRLLLKPKFQYGWSLGEGWSWVAVLTFGIVVLAMVLDALRQRVPTPVEIPAFLLIISAGAFGALMLSGSMLLAQFAAVLGAAVFGTLVFTIRKVALGRGIALLFSLLLGALLVSGYFFAELPALSAILLAFSPVPALIPIGAPKKLLAFGIRAVLVAIPVASALLLAFRSSPPLSY